MPKVKSCELIIEPSLNNNRTIFLKYSVFFTVKNNEFYLDIPNFFMEIEELKLTEKRLTAPTYNEVTKKLNKIVNKYQDIFNQDTEDIYKKVIFYKWKYSFENDKFDFDFNFTIVKKSTRNIITREWYDAFHGSSRYEDRGNTFYIFNQKLPHFHDNDKINETEYKFNSFHGLDLREYKQIEYSEEIEEKLRYFQYLLHNFSEVLKEVFKNSKDTNILEFKPTEKILSLTHKKEGK